MPQVRSASWMHLSTYVIHPKIQGAPLSIWIDVPIFERLPGLQVPIVLKPPLPQNNQSEYHYELDADRAKFVEKCY